MIIIETKEKGRCVFAEKEYKEWETIEVCEYIRIPKSEIDILEKTVINDYRFGEYWEDWDAMIFLGNGSLYNHSKNPNMIPLTNDWKEYWFVAIKDIAIGDELVFDYWYETKFKPVGNLHYRKKQDVKKQEDDKEQNQNKKEEWAEIL